MFRKLLSVGILYLPYIIPQVSAGNILVLNQCTFDIWCGAAKNDGTFAPSVEVPSGQTYLSPKPANPDNIGVVVKCGTDAGLLQPWQVEVAVDGNGKTWLDLSAIDGSPFLAYNRAAAIPGTTCTINCPAGTSDCEWPYMVDCMSTADVTVSIC